MNEKEAHKYSFADLMKWPELPRYELIGGEAVLFATPMRRHQKIVGRLFNKIFNYLDGKQCEVYDAPLGARLFQKDGEKTEDADTVLIPDISVICDPNKLDDYGVKGAPDMIVEVLSPSNRRHDVWTKFHLYEKAGVREYWIVDPDKNTLAVHLLDEGKYGSPLFYIETAKVKVEVLDDCWIDLWEVFAE